MKQWLIIGLLCILSLGIRIYQLGSLPVILNRDEAALAYNAELLMETGKDEWGRHWPLALQSFGDYKLPGYVISIMPFFKLFGYHDWVVRLPSVLAGLALIPLSYAFAKMLHWSNKQGLGLALLVATTPVFFFYSRIGFEANSALSLFVGALVLLLSENTTHRMFNISMALLLLFMAVFTYNTPLLLLPFLAMLLPLWFGIKQYKKWLIPTMGVLLVLVIGGIQLLSLSKQKSGITIFQDESVWKQSVDNYEHWHGIWRVLFGNKVVFFGSKIAQNYARSFSLDWLVGGEGGHPWHSLPGSGHLLLVTCFLSMVGIIISFLKPTKQRLLLLGLLLCALLPAAITVDAPHATRSLLFFFLVTVFASYGLSDVLVVVKKKYHSVVLVTLTFIIAASFSNYIAMYFIKYPQQQAQVHLKPGFAEVIQKVEQQHPHEPIAIVDDEGFHYILTAWYLKVPSQTFFDTIIHQQPDKIGFRYGQQVSHYHFIAKASDRSEKEKVLVSWSEVAKTWKVTE